MRNKEVLRYCLSISFILFNKYPFDHSKRLLSHSLFFIPYFSFSFLINLSINCLNENNQVL